MGILGYSLFAFAIGESECKESWVFFLENLSSMLGGFSYDKPWTFMSDRQKGLVEIINEVVTNVVNRRCARDIYANFRVQFPGAALKRHAFDERLKNDHVTNNISESFNLWVGDLRSKLVLTLVDALRTKLTCKLQKRKLKGLKLSGDLVPNIVKRIELVGKGRPGEVHPICCSNKNKQENKNYETINLEHALGDAEMKLPEKFLVMSIVDKFFKSWENFDMTLKHQKRRLTLDDHMIAISIKEQHRNQTHKMPVEHHPRANLIVGKQKAISGRIVSMGSSSTAEVLRIGSVDLKFPSSSSTSLTHEESDEPRRTKQWKKSVKSEMDFIVSSGTWVLVYLPPRCTTIGYGCEIAFLYGELEEEIYMNQPEGFVAYGNERKGTKISERNSITGHTLWQIPVVLEGSSDGSWIVKNSRSNGRSRYVITLGGA
ncbi:hypothetical protein Sango_0263600 [Sesamum angolense]|uniref:Uncharacterized protein n=1 Tax=Sesamum angolense TaxID=2727404 RepID=A0AAE2C7I2_9LAMI|nr:hypothetical protein Sango_0263600 [Sesamum angolense]